VVQRAIIAAFLGAVLGAAAAYGLALRRRRFTSRFQPETILATPLLSDIPDFESERISSLLPVLSQPATASAEAYRFVAASIQLDIRQRGIKKFAFVSSSRSDGKTVTVANVAIALAQAGLRVLAIDADADSQDLTRILYRQPRTDSGLSEVLQGIVTPAQALRQNSLDPELSLVVLPPGMKGQLIADPSGMTKSNAAFDELCARFDVVLIDAPAFLAVASAGLVVSLSDGIIAVVRHGASPGPVTELRDRLTPIGKPIAGYVYNRAPLRQELLAYYAGPTMVKAER
jgi:Mrp family chromosome partitioning ATPase